MSNQNDELPEIHLPEDLLAAEEKLTFGHTVFAVLARQDKKFVMGFRESFKVSKKEWYGMYMYGPDDLAELKSACKAKASLEKMLAKDLKKYGDRIDAIVIGADYAFLAYAEGLIIINELVALGNYLYQGSISLNGKVWKLIVDEPNHFLGRRYGAASFDSELKILK